MHLLFIGISKSFTAQKGFIHTCTPRVHGDRDYRLLVASRNSISQALIARLPHLLAMGIWGNPLPPPPPPSSLFFGEDNTALITGLVAALLLLLLIYSSKGTAGASTTAADAARQAKVPAKVSPPTRPKSNLKPEPEPAAKSPPKPAPAPVIPVTQSPDAIPTTTGSDALQASLQAKLEARRRDEAKDEVVVATASSAARPAPMPERGGSFLSRLVARPRGATGRRPREREKKTA